MARLVELHDLATFWEFIERGDSLTAASERVLALLPELENSAELFMEEIDSNVLRVKTEFNRSKEGNDSKQPSAPAQRRQRLRSGLTGAVAKLGGDIPEPVRELFQLYAPATEFKVSVETTPTLDGPDMFMWIRHIVKTIATQRTAEEKENPGITSWV